MDQYYKLKLFLVLLLIVLVAYQTNKVYKSATADNSLTSGLFCGQSGSVCEEFYTEACDPTDATKGIKNCHSTGRCRAQGDRSECIFDQSQHTCSSCVNNSEDSDFCQHIIGTGATRVLFIPYLFSNKDDFSKYTSRAIENVKKTNLGDRYNNFSFVAYNKFDGTYGCHDGIPFPGGKQFGCTDEKAINEAMAECGANATLIIANVDGLGGYSVQGSGIASIKKGTVSYSAHELGHAIATLDDEYSFNRPARRKDAGPNCSSSNKCSWQIRFPDQSCIPTCGFTNWYRSTEKSVMNKNENKNDEWNLVSLEAWEKAMKYRTLSYLDKIEKVKREYHKSLFIHLDVTPQEFMAIREIRIDDTYPVDLNQGLTNNYYALTMYDSNKQKLYSGQFPSRSVRYSEPNGSEDVLRTEIVLNLPFYATLFSLEITDQNGTKKLDLKLSDYSLRIPPSSQNLCGNGVCDVLIGENAESCFSDCRPQNDYRNNYKEHSSDINRDGITNILDCSMCLQEYRKTTPFARCDIISDSKIDVLDYTVCIDNLGKTIEHSPETQFEEPVVTPSNK